MNFDTTHEYHIDDPFIHYNNENDCIMICGHHGNSAERLVIYGLEAGVMNHFRLELNKENLDNVVNQNVSA